MYKQYNNGIFHSCVIRKGNRKSIWRSLLITGTIIGKCIPVELKFVAMTIHWLYKNQWDKKQDIG